MEKYDIHKPWTVQDDIDFMRRIGVPETEIEKYRRMKE